MNLLTKFKSILTHSLLLCQDNFHYSLKGTNPDLNLKVKNIDFPKDHTP